MKIIDNIVALFRPSHARLNTSFAMFGDWMENRLAFANAIFINICDLLTDLVNDVTLMPKTSGADALLLAEFKWFFNHYGKMTLNKLFSDGYAVIGYNALGFKLLRPDQYITRSEDKWNYIQAIDLSMQVYVMRSQTFEQYQMSDRQLCLPYLQYIDNIMNGSNTVSARMGALIAATPTQPTQNPATELLKPDQREQIAKEVSENYGSLRKQKQFLLFNRPMNFHTVALSAIDTKANEKMKLAILAICDRVKVPANQVAIIDALSAKSLSNGSELREGDFMKYQSFERLLNQTFINFGIAIGIDLDYTIYNKPTRTLAPLLTTQTTV